MCSGRLLLNLQVSELGEKKCRMNRNISDSRVKEWSQMSRDTQVELFYINNKHLTWSRIIGVPYVWFADINMFHLFCSVIVSCYFLWKWVCSLNNLEMDSKTCDNSDDVALTNSSMWKRINYGKFIQDFAAVWTKKWHSSRKHWTYVFSRGLLPQVDSINSRECSLLLLMCSSLFSEVGEYLFHMKHEEVNFNKRTECFVFIHKWLTGRLLKLPSKALNVLLNRNSFCCMFCWNLSIFRKFWIFSYLTFTISLIRHSFRDVLGRKKN